MKTWKKIRKTFSREEIIRKFAQIKKDVLCEGFRNFSDCFLSILIVHERSKTGTGNLEMPGQGKEEEILAHLRGVNIPNLRNQIKPQY